MQYHMVAYHQHLTTKEIRDYDGTFFPLPINQRNIERLCSQSDKGNDLINFKLSVFLSLSRTSAGNMIGMILINM